MVPAHCNSLCHSLASSQAHVAVLWELGAHTELTVTGSQRVTLFRTGIGGISQSGASAFLLPWSATFSPIYHAETKLEVILNMCSVAAPQLTWTFVEGMGVRRGRPCSLEGSWHASVGLFLGLSQPAQQFHKRASSARVELLNP